ncbi:MAG: NTP transferase domain-containing protein, partial [Lachnospiraceae bacterium]|nr:NTP transferase domain-containing protein [Lachnospiraceae bacterium]
MQAVILAAGMGKRLKNLTRDNTKCMLEVNGITLIERALRILDRKGLSRIVLVVGYEGQKLIEYINLLNIQTSIHFINNSVYN